MSEEKELKFSRDHYDRLMEGQEQWVEFHRHFRGEGDPWRAFAANNPGGTATIVKLVEAWNKPGPAQVRLALLEGANLRWAYLAGVKLVGAHLEGADLNHAYLHGAMLEGAHLEGAKLSGARLENAVLMAASLQGAKLTQAHLERANLVTAHLEDAMLIEAHLEGARLGGAHLQGADLRGARMGNTTWTQTRISNTTKLSPLYFSPDHSSMNDGSERVIVVGWGRWLNWGMIRSVGALPVFEVSYVALAASLITINSIGYLNRYLNGPEVSQWFEYPIPTPARMTWLFWASLLLVVGTTIYKLRCPRRVQDFSETEWVEQHGHARIQYLAESLRRRWAQIFSSGFTAVGGVIGLALLVDRVVATFRYLYP